jgi:hypothetical protein
MTKDNEFPVLAYTHMNDGAPVWVSQVPGEGGADWGYTTREKGHNGCDVAKPLSKYWWQRFAKDQARVGRCAFAVPV